MAATANSPKTQKKTIRANSKHVKLTNIWCGGSWDYSQHKL